MKSGGGRIDDDCGAGWETLSCKRKGKETGRLEKDNVQCY